MGLTSIKAGEATVEISADDSKLVKGLNSAKSHINSWVPSLKTIATTAAAVSAATVAAMVSIVKITADVASEIKDLADKTGISAKSISTLKYAAGQTGTELGGLQAAMRNIAKELDAGGKSFEKYGINVDRFRMLKPEEQFKAVAEAISRIKDPTARAAAALDMFGKSGQDLLPMVEGGAAGIDAMQREAERLGLSMSNKAAAAGEQFGDSLSTVGMQVQALATKIGSALIPHLQPLIDKVIEAGAAFLHWLDKMPVAFDLTLAAISRFTGQALDLFAALASYIAKGEIVAAIQTVASYWNIYFLEAVKIAAQAFQAIWQTEVVQFMIDGTNRAMSAMVKALAFAKVATGNVAGGMMLAAESEKIQKENKLGALGFNVANGMSKIVEKAKADFDAMIKGAGVGKPKGNDLLQVPDTARRLRLGLGEPNPQVQTDPSKLSLASVGTFNARAAGGLAGNSDTAAIRVATQQTARNTARLAAAGGAAQVVFGA